MQQKTLILTLIALGVIGVGVYFSSKLVSRHIQNEYLAEVFTLISSVSSYTQDVETEIELSGRLLRVKGFYYNDLEHEEFVSFATTTLLIPGDLNTVFTLSNIAKNETIYAKIDVVEGALDKNVPAGTGWHIFPFTAIPKEFEGIAIAGPILDNLGLFRKGGAYVSFVEKQESTELAGEFLDVYRLKRSSNAPTEPGPIASLLERVGDDGYIDIWVNDSTKHIRSIIIQNPPYFSTTTISSINNPLYFETPTQ